MYISQYIIGAVLSRYSLLLIDLVYGWSATTWCGLSDKKMFEFYRKYYENEFVS